MFYWNRRSNIDICFGRSGNECATAPIMYPDIQWLNRDGAGSVLSAGLAVTSLVPSYDVSCLLLYKADSDRIGNMSIVDD